MVCQPQGGPRLTSTVHTQQLAVEYEPHGKAIWPHAGLSSHCALWGRSCTF